jgi:hypothetical protein
MCSARNHALCDLNGLLEEKAAFPAACVCDENCLIGTAIPALIRVKECPPRA